MSAYSAAKWWNFYVKITEQRHFSKPNIVFARCSCVIRLFVLRGGESAAVSRPQHSRALRYENSEHTISRFNQNFIELVHSSQWHDRSTALSHSRKIYHTKLYLSDLRKHNKASNIARTQTLYGVETKENKQKRKQDEKTVIPTSLNCKTLLGPKSLCCLRENVFNMGQKSPSHSISAWECSAFALAHSTPRFTHGVDWAPPIR